MLLKPSALTCLSSARVTLGLPQAVSSAPIESNVLPRFQPGCMAATSARAVGELGGTDADVPAYEMVGKTATVTAAAASVTSLTSRFRKGNTSHRSDSTQESAITVQNEPRG